MVTVVTAVLKLATAVVVAVVGAVAAGLKHATAVAVADVVPRGVLLLLLLLLLMWYHVHVVLLWGAAVAVGAAMAVPAGLAAEAVHVQALPAACHLLLMWLQPLPAAESAAEFGHLTMMRAAVKQHQAHSRSAPSRCLQIMVWEAPS